METFRIILLLFCIPSISLFALDAELPPIAADADSLDLSFWSTQQVLEDDWERRQEGDQSKNIQVSSSLGSGWKESNGLFYLTGQTFVCYEKTNMGFNIKKRLSAQRNDFEFSLYTDMKNAGAMQNLIIGDYRMRWGEGLILGRMKSERTNNAVVRDPHLNTGYMRGATLQTEYGKTRLMLFSGMYPLYAELVNGKYERISSNTSDTRYQRLSDGLSVSGIGLTYANLFMNMGLLAMKQEFAYGFDDSLYGRENTIQSVIYSFHPSSMTFKGESAVSGKKKTTVNTLQWGRAGFQQMLSYYACSSYFPGWLRSGGLRKPVAYDSNIMQYQMSAELAGGLSLRTSFSLEKRMAQNVDRIAKQYLGLTYSTKGSDFQLLMQFRQQPSSNPDDSTGMRETLPMQMARLSWKQVISPTWSTSMAFRDKLYKTTADIRKHGIMVSNDIRWTSSIASAALQITMLQTRSALYVYDQDAAVEPDEWLSGEDLKYKISLQTKKYPIMLSYQGSFWNKKQEKIEMEIKLEHCF